MDYESEGWIKVYTRDTATWRATSLGARGLALELSRNMGRFSDEISLGAKGLRAVAALVSAPWDEVEPLIRELIDDGRLEYDEERQVLRDPEHLARQQSVTSPAQRKRDERNRSRTVTRGHAKSRGASEDSPHVTSSHDQREEKEEKEEREETRARTEHADAPEPEPEPPPRSVTDPPPWVADAIGTVEFQTGETFDPAVVWLAYSGKRTSDGKALCAPDFAGFLARWAARAKSERVNAREREANRPALQLVKAPPDAPAPYHASFADETPDEPAADRNAAIEASRRLAAVLA